MEGKKKRKEEGRERDKKRHRVESFRNICVISWNARHCTVCWGAYSPIEETDENIQIVTELRVVLHTYEQNVMM